MREISELLSFFMQLGVRFFLARLLSVRGCRGGNDRSCVLSANKIIPHKDKSSLAVGLAIHLTVLPPIFSVREAKP